MLQLVTSSGGRNVLVAKSYNLLATKHLHMYFLLGKLVYLYSQLSPLQLLSASFALANCRINLVMPCASATLRLDSRQERKEGGGKKRLLEETAEMSSTVQTTEMQFKGESILIPRTDPLLLHKRLCRGLYQVKSSWICSALFFFFLLKNSNAVMSSLKLLRVTSDRHGKLASYRKQLSSQEPSLYPYIVKQQLPRKRQV